VASNFAPSLASEARDGVRVVRKEYPEGLAGVVMSLEAIAQHIREGAISKSVMGWSMDQLRAAGVDGRSGPPPYGNASNFKKASVLLDAIRAVTIYTADPPGVELVKSAEAMLCLKPGLCIRGGDCDDMTVLLGAACMSVGVPVRVVKQTFNGGDQEHVMLEAEYESGMGWFPMDPSTNLPCGRKYPATSEFRLDPQNPSMIGLTGVPEAEFVGIGKPHHDHVHVGQKPCKCGGKCKPCGARARGMGRLPPRVVSARVGMGRVGFGQNGSSSGSASGSSSATSSDGTSGGTANGTNTTLSPLPTWTAPTTGGYVQAAADLNTDLVTPIGTGDTSYTSGDYATAITNYQTAGQAGAVTVGPEIDLGPAPNVTQSYTQQAWNLNTSLAAISSTSTAQTDADTARGYVVQMVSLYEQAIDAGNAASPSGTATTSGGSGPNLTMLQTGAAVVGLGALAGLLYQHFKPVATKAVRKRRR
jgi:hypothetical protein